MGCFDDPPLFTEATIAPTIKNTEVYDCRLGAKVLMKYVSEILFLFHISLYIYANFVWVSPQKPLFTIILALLLFIVNRKAQRRINITFVNIKYVRILRIKVFI